MRITTNYEAARADKGNRAVAYAQILRSTPDAINEDPETLAQWIDDVIADWCADLRQELNEGRFS